jgi:hypothetical protein
MALNFTLQFPDGFQSAETRPPLTLSELTPLIASAGTSIYPGSCRVNALARIASVSLTGALMLPRNP